MPWPGLFSAQTHGRPRKCTAAFCLPVKKFSAAANKTGCLGLK
ncbi:hypothetical protein HMPREF1545_03366 [Oscillibacter sp. KLE 1728]|nr:hypothetical protein HMPREF1545_03366 [Oscillibacter sp. KLE 1728]